MKRLREALDYPPNPTDQGAAPAPLHPVVGRMQEQPNNTMQEDKP
jgi:hypothetical protein